MLYDIQEIQRRMPHRYPFSLVDRVESVNDDKTEIIAIKNVTINEPFFQGHFPGAPVMPGVLQLEAMAQVCGLLAYERLTEEERNDGRIFFFAGIENAKFKHTVVPGDTLRIEARFLHSRMGMSKFEAKAFVGETLACSAVMLSARKKA